MSLEDKCAPTSVLFICIGFSLPLCPLDLSRKGHKSSTTNWALLSRRDGTSVWCSTRSWVRELHPVFVQIKRVGLWFFADNNTMTSCYQQVPPRYAVPGSCLRSPFTRGPPSRLLALPPGIPQLPWYRFLVLLLPYHSYLHCRAVQVVEVPQKLLPTVCVESARELWLDKGHNAHSHFL